MKITKSSFMAVLVLLMTACSSNDDNDIARQPLQADGIPFTATISTTGSTATRALNENGTTIEATWAVGERVALIHNGVNDEMTVQSVTDGVATITGTITGSPSDGDAVTVIYPSSAADGATGNVKAGLIAAQNGMLNGTDGTSIAEKYDVRKGTGTLKVSGKASLNGNISLTNQHAIFKLTLKGVDDKDVSATSVVIGDQTGGTVTTVTPASGYDRVMYVALPTTATTLKFMVTGSDSKKYFNMASSLALSTSYYQSTVKLATVGDVILPTGKCAKAGTSGAVAMIAYLGNGSDCTNGLAIQLGRSSGPINWGNAKTHVAGLTPVPGGTWRLPSKADWQNMFLGCAKAGDASSASDSMKPIAGFKEKIAATGTGWISDYHWSSTPYRGSYVWCVNLELDGGEASARFSKDGYVYNIGQVLGCLAF